MGKSFTGRNPRTIQRERDEPKANPNNDADQEKESKQTKTVRSRKIYISF